MQQKPKFVRRVGPGKSRTMEKTFLPLSSDNVRNEMKVMHHESTRTNRHHARSIAIAERNQKRMGAGCPVRTHPSRKSRNSKPSVLSGRTGFGTHSVRGALRRLQDAKRIERQRRSYFRFDYADRYRILDQPRIKIPDIEWTNFGLGPSAWAIYQRLDPTDLRKVTDLASWTQQSQPTVRKRLREMEAVGLAVRAGVRWRGSDGTQSLELVRNAALGVQVERQEVLAEEQKRWRRIVGAYLQRLEDKQASFRERDQYRNRMEVERRRK